VAAAEKSSYLIKMLILSTFENVFTPVFFTIAQKDISIFIKNKKVDKEFLKWSNSRRKRKDFASGAGYTVPCAEIPMPSGFFMGLWCFATTRMDPRN
jgi:hypothetical protein